MKKTTIAILTSAVLALAACGTTGGSAESDPTSGTNRPSASSESTSSASPEGEAGTADAPVDEADETFEDEPTDELTGEDPGVLEFGKPFKYSDGLQVTVSKPTSVQTAYGPGSAFKVTVVNGTDAAFDPSGIYATVQSGNTEAEEIFDFENGYEGAPMTTVLPDREVTFTLAYETASPDDIVMEFEPDFGIKYGPLIFATDGGN